MKTLLRLVGAGLLVFWFSCAYLAVQLLYAGKCFGGNTCSADDVLMNTIMLFLTGLFFIGGSIGCFFAAKEL